MAPRCLRWDPYLRGSITMHPVVCDSRPRGGPAGRAHPARSPTCTPGLGICQCGRHRRSRRRSGNARICPVTPVSDRPSGRHPIVRARIGTSRCHAVRAPVSTMRQFTGPQDRPSSREKSCSQTGYGPAVSSHRKRAKNSRPAYSADPTDTPSPPANEPRTEASSTPGRVLEAHQICHSSLSGRQRPPAAGQLARRPGTAVNQRRPI